MYEHDEDDHHSPSSHNQVDEKKLRAQTENDFKKNEQELKNSLSVEMTKDGKAKLFGMEIPKVLAPTIKAVFDTSTAYLSGPISDFVYNKTKVLAPKLGLEGHGTALAAEMIARGLIIGARPASQFIGANKDYAVERMRLRSEMLSICEATGANYTQNEVIRGAFKKVHDDWSYNLQLILPTVVSLAPSIFISIQDHQHITAKRNAEALGAAGIEHTVDSVVAKHLKEAETLVQRNTQIKELESKAFKEFMSKHRKKAYDEIVAKRESRYLNSPKLKNQNTETRNVSDYDFQEYFREHIWNDVKKSLNANKKDPAHPNAPVQNGDNKNFLLAMVGTSSALGESYADYMREEHQKNDKKHTSYELITTLKEQMQGEQDVNDVHKQVVEIFQALETDMGRNRFAGGLLEKLQDSTKQIAEYISNRRLDPLTLIKLAGENKVVEHSKSGKRTFRNEKDIEASVAELLGNQAGKSTEISAKEFLATFANPLLAKETIKKNLESMPAGDEKDFFVSVMPTEILVAAGMKLKEVHEQRRKAHAKLYDQVTYAVINIAAQDEELLKKHNLSTEEIASIKSLNERILEGDKEETKIRVDSRDGMLNAIATDLLNQQMSGKKNTWTQLVSKAGTVSERIQELRAEMQKSPGAIDTAEAQETQEAPEEQSFASKHKPIEGGFANKALAAAPQASQAI